jgi:hypothetical protein
VQVGSKVEAGARKWNWAQKSRGTLAIIVTEVRLVRKAGIRGLKVLTEGLPNPNPLGSGHLRLLLLGLDVLGLGLCLRGLPFYLQPWSICTRRVQRSRV